MSNAPIHRLTLETSGGSVEALRAEPAAPRAVVIALHGGSHDAQYWHHPAAPEASLLVLGSMLGFDVIALDRPGHGGSLASFPNGASLEEQVGIILDITRTQGTERGLPVFLIGHSLGSVLALMATASGRGALIAGIDVAGAPVRFTDEQDSSIRALIAHSAQAGEARSPATDTDVLRAMFFGDDGSFDPAVLSNDPIEHRAMLKEIAEVVDFPKWAKSSVQAIAVPVQWTFAAQEVSSLLTPDLPDQVREWLSGSRDARIVMQQDSGHNISLHHVGRAYHLRAFAFFEEILACRPNDKG